MENIEELNKNDEKIKEKKKKWNNLQKTIKEEITLKQMIISQQENYKNKLIKDYQDYYKAKLESRQIFENILIIDQNELNDLKKYNESQEAENKLQDAFDPISKLLFLFRSNYDYILTIFSIIGEMEIKNKENIKKIESLIDLFCHQFYDNILIPNPEQEELLILFYLLLEKEITSMNLASCSSFLENTIIGIFLKSYTKKQELKNYLSITLGSLILSIENENDGCLNINLGKIKEHVEKFSDNNNNRNDNSEITEKMLTKDIPHCKIHFHSILYVNEDKNEDENNQNENNINNRIKYNNDYPIELTQDVLIDRSKNEKDSNLRELYYRQLEKINKDQNVFTNKKFIQSLKNISENRMETFNRYKTNFLRIQKYIDCIIQSLIDKIATIPYPLRCICKIIYMLIDKKFPKISKYERNAFIGEFIFGKCILPILINSDINAIITSTILSRETRDCLTEIAKVLTKINRGMFFEANLETDFTIFNHYIIEVIPLINKFYDNLIDVQLPKVLDVLLQNHMKNINVSNIKQIILKKGRNYTGEKAKFNHFFIENNENKKEEKNENYNKMITETYNYFQENNDEIFNIQCICFSIEDILFLISILKNRLKEFENLPKYDFFNRTMDRILSEEYKLDQEIINNKERNFFLVFKEIINPKYSFLKEDNENRKEEKNKNEEGELNFILNKVKICIKNVLTGLNLLNNKDYPYLNIADSTKNFFSALKYTLDDYGDNEEGELYNGIPLSWYSQYISNNINMIDNEYQNNDFEKLYDLLYNEENNTLIKLREFISIFNTRFGLNQRCSEKIIEKAKKDVNKIKVIERFMKMEKLINIKIYAIFINQSQQILQNNKKEKNKNDDDDDSPPSFLIKKEMPRTKPSNYIEIRSIDDFIQIFSEKSLNKNNLNCPDILLKIKEDIETGDQKNKIYQTISDFLDIINQSINKSDLFIKDNEDERNFIREGIQNHILKKIYKTVFPKEPLKQDVEFYETTCKLSWIKPEQLDIKKIYVNELKYAEKCVSKIDSGKSVYEKLKYIADAHNTINNTIKFSTGQNSNAGADDLSPIFQYIIIKARPKRFFSNINYIKCFLGPNQVKGINGFLLGQMEFAAEFIMRIDCNKVKLNPEEFENNIKNSIIFKK